MKSLTWRVTLVGAWITGVALATSLCPTREWKRPVPRCSEIIFGPAVDSLARLETKRRIVRDVLAGRTSLLMGAAEFRRIRLSEHAPSWFPRPTCFAGAASKDEGYCRWVIAYASAEAPPERAEDVTKRLQAELAAMIRNGTLHLPDADGANPVDEPG